jgi:hypothetical protein
MKRFEASLIAGFLLIGAGILFLLANLGVLGSAIGMLWALIFALCGTAFLRVYTIDHTRWWALIPGCTLVGLGVLVGLDQFDLVGADSLGGALFLGAISLGFWLVYLTSPARWWAIIPGGTLLTLAAIAELSIRWPGADLGWLFFLGLALTFGLVYLDPTAARRRPWALYPAAVLGAMAVLMMASLSSALNIFWPIVMILAGLYLAYRALRASAPPALSVVPEPQPDDSQHVERLIASAVAQDEPLAGNTDQPSVVPDADTALAVVEHKEEL